MKPIVKKITIIVLSVAVCIGCLCIPASAQWMIPDVPFDNYGVNYRLFTPTRITARATKMAEINDNRIYGTIVTPEIAYGYNLPYNGDSARTINQTFSQTWTDGITTAIFNALKQFNSKFICYYPDNATADSVPTRFVYAGRFTGDTSIFNSVDYSPLVMQLDFPAFYVKQPFINSGVSYQFYDRLANISDATQARIAQVTYAIYDEETDGLTMFTETITLGASGDLIVDILGDLSESPYINPETGEIFFSSLSIQYQTKVEKDGYFKLTYEPRTDNSPVRIQNRNDLGIVEQTISYEEFNLLEWIGDSLTSVFDATLFQLGDVSVTIGGALAVPLSLMFLIAFLKKFAGG